MKISSALLDQFGRFVETHTGLNLPVGRESALLRGMDAIARELGCDDVELCVRELMSRPVTRTVIGLLATHFAVGETYFFREPAVFQALEYEVLPPLIAERRAGSRRLCIWSAGCCSGEEAYSMAILLDRLIPDSKDWEITIIGTDIHPGFLQKAEQGIYRDWSFRDVPAWIRKRHFETPEPGCHAVPPHLKRMVRFHHLNLVEDAYPSGVDILLCRNVLMYFGQDRAARVVAGLRDALAPGGWLVTSAAEAGRELFSGFAAVRFSDVVFYRRELRHESLRESTTGADIGMAPMADVERALPQRPDKPKGKGLKASEVQARAHEAITRARSCADLGLLAEADRWCEAGLAIDKCNAGLRYLRATIAEQQGRIELAMALLRQTIYLDQDFVLAHVALAGLCRRCGRQADAQRHYANAVRLLEDYRHDAVLPGAEGISVGWLADMIRASVEATNEDARRT